MIKAPDRIFLYREGQKHFDPEWHEDKVSDMEDIEYVRVGALMDWINEKRIEFMPGNDDISGVKTMRHLARTIVLDSIEQKIKSL